MIAVAQALLRYVSGIAFSKGGPKRCPVFVVSSCSVFL